MDDDFCNQAYFNGIRHITIEIGKNNLSAIAVDYVSSNNGELSDVDIICHDQQNPSLIGLNLSIRRVLSFIQWICFWKATEATKTYLCINHIFPIVNV